MGANSSKIDVDKFTSRIDSFKSTSGMDDFVARYAKDVGFAGKEKELSYIALAGLAAITLVVYNYYGKFIFDVVAFVLPAFQTLQLLSSKSGVAVASRNHIYSYWLFFSLWNSIEPFMTETVDDAIIRLCYPIFKAGVLLLVYSSHEVDIWLGVLIHYLCLFMPAIFPEGPDVYKNSGSESNNTSKIAQSEEDSKSAKSDLSSQAGDIFVCINKVELPESTDVMIAVQAKPSSTRNAFPAENHIHKTRVAIGTSIIFNHSITIGPLLKWDGYLEVSVIKKPTYGTQKTLMTNDIFLSDYEIVADHDDDSTDFSLVNNGICVTGTIKLVHNKSIIM